MTSRTLAFIIPVVMLIIIIWGTKRIIIMVARLRIIVLIIISINPTVTTRCMVKLWTVIIKVKPLFRGQYYKVFPKPHLKWNSQLMLLATLVCFYKRSFKVEYCHKDRFHNFNKTFLVSMVVITIFTIFFFVVRNLYNNNNNMSYNKLER